MRKMRVRSERMPQIGDIRCYTPIHDILTSNNTTFENLTENTIIKNIIKKKNAKTFIPI
jgi:hypothetical protein